MDSWIFFTAVCSFFDRSYSIQCVSKYCVKSKKNIATFVNVSICRFLIHFVNLYDFGLWSNLLNFTHLCLLSSILSIFDQFSISWLSLSFFLDFWRFLSSFAFGRFSIYFVDLCLGIMFWNIQSVAIEVWQSPKQY